jgi:hypothetical protein
VSCARTIPAALERTWQVAEAHINTEATRTPEQGWNDPRLRGRIFVISDAQVTDDAPEPGDCRSPRAASARMDLVKLVGGSMAGVGMDPPRQATPAGYELKTGPDQSVEVTRLTCQNGLWQGGLGADGGLKGAWMHVGCDGRLVLRWYDETILILDRLAAHATARDDVEDGESLRKQLPASQKARHRRRHGCISAMLAATTSDACCSRWRSGWMRCSQRHRADAADHRSAATGAMASDASRGRMEPLTVCPSAFADTGIPT